MAGGVAPAAPRPRLHKLSVEGREFAMDANHYNGAMNNLTLLNSHLA